MTSIHLAYRVGNRPPGKIKGGNAPLSTPDSPATTLPLPVAHTKKRKSAFASQIWSVERRPGFAFPSLYGFSG